MTRYSNHIPHSDINPKKSHWPIVAAIGGGALFLGWMGIMTASLLKPDQNTVALMELLREEREINTTLALQAQTTTAAPALSPADRDALLEDLVTRSNQSDFLTSPIEASQDTSLQTSAIVAAAIEQQNSNTSALEQMVGADPCIATLSDLVQGARIPFNVASVQPTTANLEIARQIAITASTCPAVMVAVEGHTDPSGNEVDNLLISWQRAEGTIAMLAAEGFDVARFEPLGFGSRHLADQGLDAQAAAVNRRVQFHLAPMPGQ